MRMLYTVLICAVSIPMSGHAEERDLERMKRLERRFSGSIQIEESTLADAREIPLESNEEQETEKRGLFGSKEELMSPSVPAAPRAPVVRRRVSQEKTEGWGWLHEEVVRDRASQAAVAAAELEAAESTSDLPDWRSSMMSEAEVAAEVASRLKVDSTYSGSRIPEEKLNPLKLLKPYKAMGSDYLSPAQKMTSPEYVRAQMEARRAEQEKAVSAVPFGAGVKPYMAEAPGAAATTPSFSLRAPSFEPQVSVQTKPTVADRYKPRNTSIRDLKKLRIDDDPFQNDMLQPRRSIWDE
jgi:hypothetical protein